MNAIPTFLRYLCASILLRCSNFGYIGWIPLCLFLLASPALATTINDYDGDHKFDPTIYDEANGNWTVLFSSQNYAPGLQPILGSIGWRPAPGAVDRFGRPSPTTNTTPGTSSAWWR